MRPPQFPFAALVGLDSLKLALQLAALDVRLSVLVRGDKGAGKTTAARALNGLLAEDAPFVNLPLGATEDRLLGGLDLERTLKGDPVLKRGLLAEAHGGVLYIDEVNLLPDHLADALLDAAASGVHVVQREGFSAVQDAQFVLIGSMNPEEGALRPQLLDRFALAVDVSAPLDARERRDAVERRLQFDRSPLALGEAWRAEEDALRYRLSAARTRLPDVVCPVEVLDYISTCICARGVRSLRADLAAVRSSLALAALDGASRVSQEHAETVMPFVLHHRRPVVREAPPLPPPGAASTPDEGHAMSSRTDDHAQVFAPLPVHAPRLVVNRPGEAGQHASRLEAPRRGPIVGGRQSAAPVELDVRRSIAHAVAETSTPQLRREDLFEAQRLPKSGTRFIFVMDSSGSQAVHHRIRLVKGAVAALLDQSARRHDEVVILAFRGASASVIVEPTRSVDEAQAALSFVPTGGRTPLAHALELASGYVTDSAMLVLLTDGRANVPNRSNDAWADALEAARAIRCPALVVDSESGPPSSGSAKRLAHAMGASYVMLDHLESSSLLRLLHQPFDEPADGD